MFNANRVTVLVSILLVAMLTMFSLLAYNSNLKETKDQTDANTNALQIEMDRVKTMQGQVDQMEAQHKATVNELCSFIKKNVGDVVDRPEVCFPKESKQEDSKNSNNQ